MTWAPPPRSGVAGLDPTALRQQLARNGWPPLPIRKHDGGSKVSGKAPGIAEWQQFAAFEADLPSLATIETWRRQEPKWPGTGIACGTAVGVDLDFGSDATLAESIRIVAFDVFGETPFERQGAAPKTCLVYRAAEPIPSLHLKAADGSGDGLDVLSDGTQFVAFGIHAKTLNPYAWIGAESPLTAGPDAAPEITQEQVDEFVQRVRAIVELSSTGGRAGRRGGEGAKIVRDAFGLVIDGREIHLMRTVYSVARSMVAEGLDLDQDTLATRAWERFATTAKVDDGHWGHVDAKIKAGAIIAKWRSGRLNFEDDEPSGEKFEPTYADYRRTLAEAESATRNVIGAFFATHVPAWIEARTIGEAAHEQWKLDEADAKQGARELPEEPAPPLPTSWGARIETAVGKTREAVRAVAAAANSGQTIAYAAPTHPLLAEIAGSFAREGVHAVVYRGYSAADPDQPGMAMCHDLPAVEDAQAAAAATVRESVCERKVDGQKLLCAFHDRCGMQRQREAKASVWLVPHALLFQAKPEFIPTPDAVVIDENVVMGALPDRPVRMTLDTIEHADREIPDETGGFHMLTNDLEVARGNLTRALRAHPKEGPLQRSILLRHHVTAALAGSAVRLEWMRLRDAAIQPGMAPKVRKALAGTVGQHNKELKAFAGLWVELRGFLAGEAEASGRLTLRYDDESGCCVLERRSLDTIIGSWNAPCLLLDATLPDPALIAPVLGHPVQVRADIAARWSEYGRVRQITAAPISASKLGIVEGREPETVRRSITDLLRIIRLRAALVEPGRVVVVIGPKRLVEKLREIGLPGNVEAGHFGAVAGIDRWNAAAGLIVIGQMQPGPRIAEALAGIVTGLVPQTLPETTGKGRGVWFPWVDGGIRLPDGSGARTRHNRHPDPTVDALRWQITEAGLIQAIGRLRALRRAASGSYFVDIVNDVPLPLTVDRVETWDSAKPGAWANMALEGVLLESASDVQACFPELAPTRDAAREVALPTVGVTPIINSLIGVSPTVRRATYKRLGPYREASALLLPNAPADLKSWLTDRLGAIKWLRIEEVEPASRPAKAPPSPATPADNPQRPAILRSANYDPDLAAAYRCVVDLPADTTRPAPVIPEIVRFDPAAGIRFPTGIADRIARLRTAEAPSPAQRRSAITRPGAGRRVAPPREAVLSSHSN